MEAKTSTIQRPMGPRPSSGPRRPPFPSLRPPTVLAPPNPPPAQPPMSIAPTPLGTPRRPGSKPMIKLNISENIKTFDIYAGGPNQQIDSFMSPPGDGDDARTIRPALTVQPVNRDGSATVSPPKPAHVESIDRLAATLQTLHIRQGPSNPQLSNDGDESIVLDGPKWSDDMLEELQCLGEGAGGSVHKVKDKRNGRLMARKTIATREAPLKQLLRELLIMSSTQHVNIITFYGAYMSPSSSEVKILMEFSEGGSLEAVGRRIRDRGAIVGEKIAGRLAEGVLQGLAYLHSMKTIHRDIKPSNILLSKEGVVKLCDFGVSGELVSSNAQTFTGTSFYMAPERICGKDYTIRSDVWSTGISLLELVQNRFPFPPDLPPIELMMYITNGEPPRLEDEVGVTWSEEMKDFIKQTLIVDPLTRPTPKDMLEHIWIKNMMKYENTMARWISQVWGWPKTRKSREDSLSRPSTADSS